MMNDIFFLSMRHKSSAFQYENKVATVRAELKVFTGTNG